MSDFEMADAGPFGCQPETTWCEALAHLIPLPVKNSEEGCPDCRADAEQAR